MSFLHCVSVQGITDIEMLGVEGHPLSRPVTDGMRRDHAEKMFLDWDPPHS